MKGIRPDLLQFFKETFHLTDGYVQTIEWGVHAI